MLYVVILFLFAAITLYFLLGGADFGAGIIELFTSTDNKHRTRKTMYQAIGPIWEANHMWLIITVVVLFVGFPVIYSEMCTYLHIPLLILLLGIIARGTAFTFRNYDAIKDENTQNFYNHMFVYSSFVTPLFLGIIAGSALSGQIDPTAKTFAGAYIFSWFNWFSVSVGFFTVALCGFLAAIYIVGESKEIADTKRYIKKAKIMNVAAVICGALVFTAAYFENVHLANWIFGNKIGVTVVVLATLSLVWLWMIISAQKNRQWIRLLAAFQVSMILIAVGHTRFPRFIIFKDGSSMSLLTDHASGKTIDDLAIGLMVGSLFILPALGYLYYSFQKKER
ncbi:cytochrome bd-I ubiquinol oxidase subunit 2 apoprotein [Mucilaginibacter pineti]|uniref:Cytochrome bd-I ubiquinol oxidase subunit 2 apoprotein n=1 Tax=Mucilaginibacter pineti TaxID=1391627 RepID=A0A1G6SXL0_9SPHI|nr:cytochrome d ubiquinol oxidase subunit II [Mucilaginibacter pineti]SDD20927.1 cytochrome bd-I ubiquinol oxidase subunit 2 apoprotein [Mucilaginibacter pineti]